MAPMSGTDIFDLRWTLGLTQQELGNELGVTDDTVRRWELGRTRIKTLHQRALRDLERLGPRPLINPSVRWGSVHWDRYHHPETGLPTGDRTGRKPGRSHAATANGD
jgi:hypothetical protein